MRSRLRENVLAIVSAAFAVWIVGRLTLYGWALTDYDFEARPSIDALLGGHVLRFLQLAPSYGGSLVIRSPFLLATRLWNGSELSVYRVAAGVCMAAIAVLAVWLVAQMRGQGHGRLARALVIGLAVANPLSLQALELGHPEELLGAALCVGAVLAAMRNRRIWAGLLLGLAIANKEWALLAIGPVLVALPDGRARTLLVASAVAGVIMLPLVLAGHFIHAVNSAATQATVIFNPWQIWWFLGGHVHTLRVAGHIIPGHHWDHRVEPGWVAVVSHPLIIACMLPLTWLCLRRRASGAPRPRQQGLLLLSLLLLLRCVLDPWDMAYYALPFAVALLAWETQSFLRPPVLALAASLTAWLVFQWDLPSRGFSPDMQSLIFVAWAISVVASTAAALYGGELTSRLGLRGRRHPVPTPA
jgi:hypothetical protein